MLDMSAAALAAVQHSYVMRMRAESWLGSELLAADIPISGGGEAVDQSSAVPETVTLQVPRLDRGVSWNPLDPGHPLAPYGQRIRVSYGVDTAFDTTEWITRGWFLVTDPQVNGDEVTITCNGLLELIQEAKFVAPFEPTGTFISTVRGLVEPALTVSFDGTLVNRSIPVGMQWDEDRIGALFEVLDAWPAVAHVNTAGVLVVEPPTIGAGTSVMNLTNGVGGTVVEWQGGGNREGAFNIVVAKGEDANGNQIRGVASDVSGTSPLRISGPFNPLPVPFVFASPLLTTVAQCRAAAATILERKRREASRKVSATLVPHPGVVAGDTFTLTGQNVGLNGVKGTLQQFTLPYDTGEMSMNLVV